MINKNKLYILNKANELHIAFHLWQNQRLKSYDQNRNLIKIVVVENLDVVDQRESVKLIKLLMGIIILKIIE